MPQRQPQRIVLAALVHRGLYIIGHAIESVCRTSTIYPLMWPLKIIMVDPVRDPSARIGKGSEVCFLKEFAPDGLPEALYLPQRHGMLRCASHVLNTVLLQHLLEPCFAPPGDKLPAIVRQDLTGRTKFAHSSFHYLQHRFRRLLSVETVGHDEPGVVIDKGNQVSLVHPFQFEGKDIGLPTMIWVLPLEATDLRWPPL